MQCRVLKRNFAKEMSKAQDIKIKFIVSTTSNKRENEEEN